MKIDKLPSDRNVKLVAHIPESVNEDLKDYRLRYKEKYGTEISDSKLVGAMLQRFMAEDVDFQRWKKAPRPKTSSMNEHAPAPGPVLSANEPTPAAGGDDAQGF